MTGDYIRSAVLQARSENEHPISAYGVPEVFVTEHDQYIGVVLESNPKTSNAAKCRRLRRSRSGR